MTEEDVELLEQSMPVLFEHCQKIYQHMLEQARPAEDGTMVWEGFLTRLITRELNFSVPFYTSTTQALKRMGCMKQLRRGGAGTPSLWALLREPDPEAFRDKAPVQSSNRSATRALEQRVRDLQAQLANLSEVVEALVEANNTNNQEEE